MTREVDGFQKQILRFSVINRLEEVLKEGVLTSNPMMCWQLFSNSRISERVCQRTIVLIASTIVAPVHNMSFRLKSGMDFHYPSHYVRRKTLARIVETKPLRVGRHHTLAQR